MPSATSTAVPSAPISTPSHPLRVAVIGAGASGLLLSYRLTRHFSPLYLTHTVYDKNPAVGGTWYENIYPGCASDTPAHCYTYSFAPKADWSATYAGSAEIRGYFADFAEKHGLGKNLKLATEVVGAAWRGDGEVWEVALREVGGERKEWIDTVDVLINAGGILNHWAMPEIPGLSSFDGPVLHSAGWDASVDLDAKRVALIGNGSSGIQILPAILPRVAALTTFIRSPTWIASAFGGQQSFTPEQQQRWKTHPDEHLAYRRETEDSLNGVFSLFYRDSELQKEIRDSSTQAMRTELGADDDEGRQLADAVIPDWSFGCRRMTPGDGYLRGLRDPKTTVVRGGIERVTASGIVDEHGAAHEVDAIICATGFDTSFIPRFPVTGRDGATLADAWASTPESYLGVAAPRFPNLLMTLSPFSPIGNGPVLVGVEAQVGYIVALLGKALKQGYATFEPRADAVAELGEHVDGFMSGMVWTDGCRSWYKGGSVEGRVAALWPGSTLHCVEALSEPRWEDWSWATRRGENGERGNRWAWLGNGYSSAETRGGGLRGGDRTAGLSYYIKNEDTARVEACLRPEILEETEQEAENGVKEQTDGANTNESSPPRRQSMIKDLFQWITSSGSAEGRRGSV